MNIIENLEWFAETGGAVLGLAFRLLGKLKRPSARQALLLAAEHKDFRLHNKALEVLADKGKESIPELERIAASEKNAGEVRMAAVYYLGKIRSDETVLALGRLMELKGRQLDDMELAWGAAQQIREIGGAHALPIVWRNFDRFKDSVYEENINCIFASFGKAARELVLQRLNDPEHVGRRFEMLEILEMLRRKEGRAVPKVAVEIGDIGLERSIFRMNARPAGAAMMPPARGRKAVL